jgi:hypothetical protein
LKTVQSFVGAVRCAITFIFVEMDATCGKRAVGEEPIL